MKKPIMFLAVFVLAAVAILPGLSGHRPGAAVPAALPSGWSAPENASNTPNFSQTPQMAIDANGAVYVVWDEWFGQLGDRRDVMFNTNQGGAWNAQRANTLQYNLIDEVGFPEVAVTANGADILYAWMDRDATRDQMVIDWDERVNGTWRGLQWISDQVSGSSWRVTIAASPVDDTICLAWEQSAPGGFYLNYQYRDAATGRLSAPAFIFPGQAGNQYHPNICVDGRGTAHVVYYAAVADAVVWYTKNANPKNLAGWTTPIALTAGTGLVASWPKVAAADDGDAYVVWTESHAGIEDVYLRYQVGGAWQAAVNLSQTPAYSEFPSVAVNPATKDVYVSWSETPDQISADIMIKTFETDKVTGTRAWSPNYQVNFTRASEQSCIRVTKEGDVHLCYAERGEIWHVQRLMPRLAAVDPPAVTSKLDRVLFAARKYNYLAFAANPANDAATLQEYRLYAKKLEEPDSAFAVLATFAPTAALSYVHKNLPVAQRYAYLVGVVNKSGLELKSGAVVSN
jgi:hypothetical protein